MAITNGYTTLQNIKDILNANGLSTNATDDSVIERIVEGASRYIDSYTGRTFYARTETRLYDVPKRGRAVYLDDDLLTVTTLTNGDGAVLTTTDYRLEPRNQAQRHLVMLKESSAVTWSETSTGNTEAAISIAGTWGWASSAPHDIRAACEIITVATYRNRTGVNATGATTITAAGVVITPSDIPAVAIAVLQSYVRYNLDNG